MRIRLLYIKMEFRIGLKFFELFVYGEKGKEEWDNWLILRLGRKERVMDIRKVSDRMYCKDSGVKRGKF